MREYEKSLPGFWSAQELRRMRAKARIQWINSLRKNHGARR